MTVVRPGGGAGSIEMVAAPGVAAATGGVDKPLPLTPPPAPPPALGGVDGLLKFAAIAGMRVGGCGSGIGSLGWMGLRPAELACAATCCCGRSAESRLMIDNTYYYSITWRDI